MTTDIGFPPVYSPVLVLPPSLQKFGIEEGTECAAGSQAGCLNRMRRYWGPVSKLLMGELILPAPAPVVLGRDNYGPKL